MQALTDDIFSIAGYDSRVDAEGYYFDEDAALEAIDFIESACLHVKGEWASREEHLILEQWQRAFVAILFGWKCKKTGLRRYREALLYVARKNGKTTLIAAICLYVLLYDDEAGRECYAAAGDRKQAKIIFDTAKGFVLRNPQMCEDLKLYRDAILLTEDENCFFRVLSREAGLQHGLNASFACVDELHVQKTPDLVDVIETSMGSRQQPLMVYITTADFLRESICNTKHDYAKKVRDGDVRDSGFLPAIFEASREDDWEDPETWKKANPNFGVSVREDWFRRQVQKAKEDVAYRNTFLRLHLNIQTDAAIAWLDTHKWDGSCEGEQLAEHAGCTVTGGIDLAVSGDMTAFALTWESDGVVNIKVWYWIPEERLREREKTDKVPIIAWVNEGLIRTTPGNVTDFNQVQADIAAICEEYGVTEVAYDKYLASQLAQNLQDDYGINVVEFTQTGANYHGPCKHLERLVNGGKIRHGKNPVLRHNVTCCKLRVTGDKVLPDRRNSTGRIDGLAAGLMALARLGQAEGIDAHYRDNELFVC